MGIILEGSGKEYDEIIKKLRSISQDMDNRHVAALFWELSALNSFHEMKKRIKKISNKRKTVVKEPGMKKPSPAVDAKCIGAALETILENIRIHYEAIVKNQKLSLESRDWDTKGEKSLRDFQYLRHVLRKYAEDIMLRDPEGAG